MIFAIDGTQVLVALIGCIGLVLSALLAQGRKAVRILGERKGDEPTLMEVLVAIHHRLGVQEEHNAHQDRRLSHIEHTVDDIDTRVITLEDLAKTQRVVDDAGRQGTIDRRDHE